MGAHNPTIPIHNTCSHSYLVQHRLPARLGDALLDGLRQRLGMAVGGVEDDVDLSVEIGMGLCMGNGNLFQDGIGGGGLGMGYVWHWAGFGMGRCMGSGT